MRGVRERTCSLESSSAYYSHSRPYPERILRRRLTCRNGSPHTPGHGIHSRAIVFYNRLPYTFHPKIYLFESPTAADIVVGSGNLTEGGLFTDYEAALRLALDLTDSEYAPILKSIERVLDGWADLSAGTVLFLDSALLAHLARISHSF